MKSNLFLTLALAFLFSFSTSCIYEVEPCEPETEEPSEGGETGGGETGGGETGGGETGGGETGGGETGGGEVGTFVSLPGNETNNDCTPWKRVRTGNIELENNVWGTNGDGRYQSCLITNADGSYGWTWSTPSGLNNNVKMYLQSVVGHKPFFHYTLGEGFPFSPNELEVFNAHFKSETNASGKYNLAFEFWTVKEYHSDDEYINKTRAGGNNITGEYMFWMQAHFGMPISHHDQLIDGRRWNVTVGGSGQLYVAFIPADGNDITEATIDFIPFIDWLEKENLINPNEKIVSLELGNEVIEGSGKTVIRDYAVNVSKK
ncbi:hypothetical protein R9C00_23150 [Flammeovirgaceae bacterium SG7u.111]|nr:hypothetical protein [Flammeovirgaceae bacterium SG7u.132]WPO34603.1 hypothetical protein R9C00_23150 [Flammeovirgaceae bacterium SG7u.111]